VKFSDFTAVGAFHFYVAARVSVIRQWLRPDHTEMALAIGAHKRTVAWHLELLHRGFVQVGEVGTAVYILLFYKSIKRIEPSKM
jgi:hypothetical protein